MNWKKIAIGAGIGAAAGYFVLQQYDKQSKVTPEKALKSAKEAFKQQGPISGSWIYMKPEEMEKNGLTYTVYRGGITRTIDGESTQYEFKVDAETGSILDVLQSA
ncbi:PepSY domain-containing protein [Virgibacillus senegalensis]|uniref:PepSY domain-containing protein n=1 Tax=Virgibacillus senegalensis TaxID=1499679 RepID=UPI00069CE3BF|nr:PepSY domain-containing protein [Virgibacillus senegalensis]